MLLLPCWSDEKGEAAQAGRRDMLAVRRRSERGGHEDRHQILLRALLLEDLEGHHLHFLRFHFEVISVISLLSPPPSNINNYLFLGWLIKSFAAGPFFFLFFLRFFFFFDWRFGLCTNFISWLYKAEEISGYLFIYLFVSTALCFFFAIFSLELKKFVWGNYLRFLSCKELEKHTCFFFAIFSLY